ncbi:MAG: ACT domain-containing protein [Clostridiaceae bacterium]
MSSKYLIVDTKILPDVYQRVIEAKELLQNQNAKDISDAVKLVGISRSTFYKYKDSVFPLSSERIQHKAIIGLAVGHKTGTLSKVLDIIAERGGNILTINQDIPINNVANVSITLDISNLSVDFSDLLEEARAVDNIVKANLIAME